MRFSVGCRLSYELSGPGTLVFNVHAINSPNQRVLSEELHVTNGGTNAGLYDEWTDPTTQNRFVRVNAEAGPLELRYRAEVESAPQLDYGFIGEISPGALPLHVMPFLYPSRYCESDRLVRLANDEFQNFLPGLSRVTAICNYIYEHIAYQRGSSGSQTSAFDTVTERAGVCRDFAHLAIAFCRALGIPARFVSGYAYGLEPPDFHACFEAFLGGKDGGAWYFFDATRLAPQTGYVRIGSGRDAADVSFATLFGAIEFRGMEIIMQTLDGPPQFTTQAIALG
ncbi:MAG TPA: transglutaminase family protein [Abditibacteriaceae bacterium]|jgi:transglutaminase-like putative cysteine protease